jgi:hypothetical protein
MFNIIELIFVHIFLSRIIIQFYDLKYFIQLQIPVVTNGHIDTTKSISYLLTIPYLCY